MSAPVTDFPHCAFFLKMFTDNSSLRNVSNVLLHDTKHKLQNLKLQMDVFLQHTFGDLRRANVFLDAVLMLP